MCPDYDLKSQDIKIYSLLLLVSQLIRYWREIYEFLKYFSRKCTCIFLHTFLSMKIRHLRIFRFRRDRSGHIDHEEFWFWQISNGYLEIIWAKIWDHTTFEFPRLSAELIKHINFQASYFLLQCISFHYAFQTAERTFHW